MTETSSDGGLPPKQVCRFCLNDDKCLSGIFDKNFNKFKLSAPLPIQVMATISIEVFSNDGMPNTICDNCRQIIDYCYRFKQMCRQADVLLRQFPLTNVWPQPLEFPKIPDEIVRNQIPQTPKILNPGARSVTIIPPSSPDSKPKIISSKIILNSGATITTFPLSDKPKILNKDSIKILNKNVQKEYEPIFTQPKTIIKEDGCTEVVTEVIDSRVIEPYDVDPSIKIKNAEPVDTAVFPCPHCERSFPLKQLLDIHVVNHTRERSYECKHCRKRFLSKYDLSKHIFTHTGEKPFVCVVCNKSFSRSTLLHRHEKVHTDIPKFLCVYCEKPFLSKIELNKHTIRHEKNRPFSCKICNKSFAFKQGLERHEAVHSKNQPYSCQYCKASFPTPSKLARHLTAHAGTRPYPCKLCPKSYLLSHHLTRHLRSHKEGSANYKCFECASTFITRDELVYHSAIHATKTLICPLCKEQFKDLDECTNHIRKHAEGEQYACEFCDLIFMTAEKLQIHSDNSHQNEWMEYEEHAKQFEGMKNMKDDASNENGQNYEINNQQKDEQPLILQEFVINEIEFNENKELISIEAYNEHAIKIEEEDIFISEQEKMHADEESSGYSDRAMHSDENGSFIDNVDVVDLDESLNINNRKHDTKKLGQAPPTKKSKLEICNVFTLPKSLTIKKSNEKIDSEKHDSKKEEKLKENVEISQPETTSKYVEKHLDQSTINLPLTKGIDPELNDGNEIEMQIGNKKVQLKKVTRLQKFKRNKK